MARKFFVGGNWKCNGTSEEVKKIVSMLKEAEIPSEDVVEVIVSPPFLLLPLVKSLLRSDFHVVAQNYWVKKGGAFTGEVRDVKLWYKALKKKNFSTLSQADVIERLRLQYTKDLLKVVDIVLSHQGVRYKNKLILWLMEALVYPNPTAYRYKLIRFSALNHRMYSELALKASRLLEQTKLSKLRSSIARSLSELETFTEEGEQPYLVKGSVRMQWHWSGLIASWEFCEEHIERRNRSEDQTIDYPMTEKHRERKWGAMVHH